MLGDRHHRPIERVFTHEDVPRSVQRGPGLEVKHPQRVPFEELPHKVKLTGWGSNILTLEDFLEVFLSLKPFLWPTLPEIAELDVIFSELASDGSDNKATLTNSFLAGASSSSSINNRGGLARSKRSFWSPRD